MKISVVGTGYVGLVSGTCFAEMGNNVTCIDIDEKKIEYLKQGKCPIYEPGLTELLEKNIAAQRLHFATNYDSVRSADITFLAVGTPSKENGEANLDYLYEAAKTTAMNLKDGSIVVVKSTVPIGTGNALREFIKEHTSKAFFLVNNPEFLKEGAAVDDFMKPDRVVIGHDNEQAGKTMERLYKQLVPQGKSIFLMSNVSAEMTKYAANCFLATKISFINEIARLCEKTGADINEVRKGMTSDVRIGTHFFYPGPGYGGSCFPKDVKALLDVALKYDMDLKVVRATEDVNKEQKQFMFHKVKEYFGDLNGKTIAFWGTAFKANTDDIRESAAIDMAESLVREGAHVRIFDPVADTNFETYMASKNIRVEKIKDKYACLEGADALVVLTEWREFRLPDFGVIKEKLNKPAIFDARNLFETELVKEYGFDYFAVGKKI